MSFLEGLIQAKPPPKPFVDAKGFKGGLAWIKPSKKDMAVNFSYSPLEY